MDISQIELYIFDLTELLSQTILSMSVAFYRPLGYERVYLPLYKVADTPYYIQGDVM